MTKIQETGDKVLANVEHVIVGKHHEVRLALVALLCRGHLLIEDVPGTGKTVLAKAIARSLGCSFRRIQFTPDLLPSDVTGLSIYNQKTQEFEFRPGPIFSQVVLADEINRATPKTQSSLLETMEERQATIDGITHPMPDPFLVIATQNPIEYEGTFALPEAQLDRFMLRIRLGYPQPIEEIVILDEQKRSHPLEELEEVLGVEDLRDLQNAVREIYVDSTVSDYIVRVVGATRNHPDVYLGASPRGSIALYRAGQALAGLLGRDYVIPDDIKALAEPALAHRLIIKTSSSIHDVQAGQVVREILDSTSDRRHPPDRRRPDRPAAATTASARRPLRPPRPAPTDGRDRIGQDAADVPTTPGAGHRHDPGRRRLLDGPAVPVLPAVPVDPRRRRVVRAGPARPVRPRGRLRRQPAPRPRRRPDAGDLHAAQHQPAAQAVAGGPQPDDAARRPARPGHHAGRPLRAVVAHPRPAGPARPLPHRAAAHPDGRSVRVLRGLGDGRPGGQRHRLPARWSRSRRGACRRPTSRAATPRPSGRSRRRPWPTTVRPYAPGDSMNRIHWRSTARHGEIQVKEFDLEQTADAWIILDLQRSVQTGRGDESTTEAAIRAAASIADKALTENRAVGHDRQRRPDRLPAGRPGRPPAPEDHAAPGGRRCRLGDAARGDARRPRSGACAGA